MKRNNDVRFVLIRFILKYTLPAIVIITVAYLFAYIVCWYVFGIDLYELQNDYLKK